MYWKQYVSRKTPLPADDVELLSVKDRYGTSDAQSTPSSSIFNPLKYELQILGGEETLAGLQADCTYSRAHLVSTLIIWTLFWSSFAGWMTEFIILNMISDSWISLEGAELNK